MADVNQNGINDDLEERAFKTRATDTRFKQQFAYGIGAAMVFGLVSGIVGKLLTISAPAAEGALVAGGGLTLMPILGLVALAVIGVGCLYVSAKLLTENIMHDQVMQAKQIGVVTRARTADIEPAVTPKVETFPELAAAPKVAAHPDTTSPDTVITGARELSDTITPRAEVKTDKQSAPDATWAAQMAHASEIATQQART